MSTNSYFPLLAKRQKQETDSNFKSTADILNLIRLYSTVILVLPEMPSCGMYLCGIHNVDIWQWGLFVLITLIWSAPVLCWLFPTLLCCVSKWSLSAGSYMGPYQMDSVHKRIDEEIVTRVWQWKWSMKKSNWMKITVISIIGLLMYYWDWICKGGTRYQLSWQASRLCSSG